MTSVADVEQMNKVRVSLGMAPLAVPGQSGPQFKGGDDSDSDSDESDDLSTLDKRAAAAGSNWQKLEAEKKEKLERQTRKEEAKKARDRAARNIKLEGKGLGEADDADEVDTRTWLLLQKKRQKKIEKLRKLEEELAEREQQQVEYTAKDLAGVKVGHEADQFDDITGEQVLTLKDAEIGEESEDDELESADLKAKEKLEERLRLAKKRPDYDPTEQGEKQNVLSKYDEEIDGKQQKRFTLDGQGSSAAEAARKRASETGQVKSKGIQISLDMLKDDAPVSDYIDPSTIKVKKPKKSKKEKKTRQRATDDDDIIVQPSNNADPDAMEVDGAAAIKKPVFEFDDDDLQAKLAESRRQALKKRKRTDAAEVARQMREEMPIDEPEPEDGGMVIDETSEFVANLKKPEEEEPIRARQSKTPQPATAMSPDQDGEDEDGDTSMAQESYGALQDRDEPAEKAEQQMTATGLEEEEDMSGQGIAGTLAMLRKRDLIANPASEDLAEKERRRENFLAEKQHLVDDYDRKAREQREADRRSGRWDKMSNREREDQARRQNDQREQYIARLLAEKFNKEYRPDVQLRYNDEYGRSMNQKEAFKHLSHMFHGKGSGKQKTEKRLKKIEDEKKESSKGMLSVDERGMTNVQGRESKRQKTAGVRLQ